MNCTRCNRDINSIGQDNMSNNSSPICEDCNKNKTIRRGDGCPDDCSQCGDTCVYDDGEGYA